ncbi:hypothetical protein A9Q91_05075 [Candidatus Gracilibacteria bacterium 28_42_T64]|nr:hypothetical protein A9Q91_05075 [Candidatus Gracilibacteria bacterium 28_42_T64]
MGINQLLSYSEHELKAYIGKQGNVAIETVLLFSARFISCLDKEAIQKAVENNKEIRKVLHVTYQAIEEVFDTSGFTNPVGDLLSEKEKLAQELMEAAKVVRNQGKKFDPSPYISGYECYNRGLHGDPLTYFKLHFGTYLKSCNEEKDYLSRGDIQIIDPSLRGALYRNYREEFIELTNLAEKKSKAILDNTTDAKKKRIRKTSMLDNASRR